MAGQVYVDGQKEDKAGTMFRQEAVIEIRGNTLPYVEPGRTEAGEGHAGISAGSERKDLHGTWERPQAGLRTVCYRTEQRKSTP